MCIDTYQCVWLLNGLILGKICGNDENVIWICELNNHFFLKMCGYDDRRAFLYLSKKVIIIFMVGLIVNTNFEVLIIVCTYNNNNIGKTCRHSILFTYEVYIRIIVSLQIVKVLTVYTTVLYACTVVCYSIKSQSDDRQRIISTT